jgi:hypothetical protein
MRTPLAISVASLLLSPQLVACVPVERVHGATAPSDWSSHVRRVTEGANTDLRGLGFIAEAIQPVTNSRPQQDGEHLRSSTTNDVKLLGYVSITYTIGTVLMRS